MITICYERIDLLIREIAQVFIRHIYNCRSHLISYEQNNTSHTLNTLDMTNHTRKRPLGNLDSPYFPGKLPCRFPPL